MKNFVQLGGVITLTAPYTVASGAGALVGAIFGVATADITSGADGEFETFGVYDLAKTSAQAWTQGQKIYWDNSNKRCDNDSTVGMLIGVAVTAAANPSSTGRVRLNGIAPSALEGPQTAITSLTDNSTGTANNTLQAVTTFTPSVAWNGSSVYPSAADATAIAAAITALTNNEADLAAKVNEILVALRTVGIIAP